MNETKIYHIANRYCGNQTKIGVHNMYLELLQELQDFIAHETGTKDDEWSLNDDVAEVQNTINLISKYLG